MNPDEQHKQYYDKNPNGNHTVPAPETLRFMQRTDLAMKDIVKEVENQKEMISETHKIAALMQSDISHIKEAVDAIQQQTSKISSRVSLLEVWKQRATGMFVLLGLLWSFFQFVFPYFNTTTEITLNDQSYEEIEAILKNYSQD